MIKKAKILKLFAIVSVLSVTLVLPSLTFAKTSVRSVSPNSITRGESKVITIKGKNLGDGSWDSIVFAPKGQNISKSTDNTIWPWLWGSYGGVTDNAITATLSTNACDNSGKYDLYLVKEQMDGNENYSYKTRAKKRNAFLVKKGKNEAKISKIKPKKIGKGGMAKVTISGKNFTKKKVSGFSTWIYKKLKKKGEEDHATTGSGSVITYTNKRIIADVTVFTDSMTGRSNLQLTSYGGSSTICAEKKNAIKIGKNKLKVQKVTPSQVSNSGNVNITISGKNLKGARSVKLINSDSSFTYLTASKIKANFKKKIVATFPVTTTTTLGSYNLEVRGPGGMGFVSDAVAITNTVQ